MILVFKKDIEGNIKLLIKKNGIEEDYSYLKMLKYIIDGDLIENYECETDITEKEKESIKSMIAQINDSINKSPEEEPPYINDDNIQEQDVTEDKIPF